MSSLTQALSIAVSGLKTDTALLAVASNNISNAQTAGYTTKTANVASTEYGGQAGGSTIASYSRATDAALTTSYNQATTNASYYSTMNGYMSQVQTILGSTSTDPALATDMANFSSAWTQYSADPESAIQQQSVISAGQQLASDLQTTTEQVGTLGAQVESDTQTSVTSLNAALQQVATLNVQIQQATTSGQDATNLEDERDTAVNKVSSYVGVSIQQRNNGQIALYTTGGQVMVDSGTAVSFSYDGSNITNNLTGATVNNALTGGTIQAELDFRDTSTTAAQSTTPGVGTLTKLQNQLSTIASALTNSNSVFATAYSSAVTASTATNASQQGDNVASSFFTVDYNPDGTADPSSLAVNNDLLTGTSEIPASGVQGVANAFTATATYTGYGLNAQNVTYSGLTSAVLSNFQQAANTVSTQSTTASSQATYYQQALSNATGVNIDTELANLISYQNSYAASAHIITTVNTMMTDLLDSF